MAIFVPFWSAIWQMCWGYLEDRLNKFGHNFQMFKSFLCLINMFISHNVIKETYKQYKLLMCVSYLNGAMLNILAEVKLAHVKSRSLRKFYVHAFNLNK